MSFTTRAEGGGYYRVLVDGVETSKHTREDKALEQAVARKEEQPASVVMIDHDFRLFVEGITAPPPEPEPEPPPPDPEPSEVAPVFSDDFEGGRTNANGFVWNSTGINVFPSTTEARSGTKSLAFRFAGNPDLTKDASAEQRFSLPAAYPEVWFDYWLHVPANYRHRRPEGPANNKLFFLWDSGGYPGGAANRLAVMLSIERMADDKSRLIFMWSADGVMMMTHEAPSFSPAMEPVGQWHRIRIHAKAATLGGSDGEFDLWWGDEHAMAVRNLPLFDPDENAFRNGYLFGWANSGYDEDTVFHVDDFKVYTEDPGW